MSGLQGEKKGWKVVETAKEVPRRLHLLMIGGIVPRLIAFVSSVRIRSREHRAVQLPSSTPPVRGDAQSSLGIHLGNNGTANIISEPSAEQANVTSIDPPESFSEWPISGLTKEPSLFQAIDIVHPVTGKAGSTTYICNDMLTDRGTVDMALFKPLSRMGDVTYACVGDGFRLVRPAWEQEKDKISELGPPIE
ncbi:hypothetical protein BU15DRAFT_68740 [Melanogaster broomeanus]|nr:hypothetical protein BU15DRAFT_68740 [Melanogaster broomeanus]